MENNLGVREIVARQRAAFLLHVDIRELYRKISEFRKLPFRSMSYWDVSEAIRNVIMFDTPLEKIGMIFPQQGRYPAGTRFYRVRSISKDDHQAPFKSMSKVSDCWEPPHRLAASKRQYSAMPSAT